MHANGVMWCLACRAYPQPGMQKAWLTGTRSLRRSAMLEHSNSGLHAVALALWESGGTSSTVIGGLPEQVHNAILGLFMLVYRIVKRMAPFENFPGDAEVATMVGSIVASAYRTRRQAMPIMHAIAAPIRAAEGSVMKDVSFFAPASNSSTDRGLHKAELIYTRTMRDGQSRTAFLGLHELQAGTAVTIPGAYKQVILRAGLSVEQWVGRLFRYCAHGASVMQSDGNGVAGLLMKLQQEVLNYSLLVLVHPNCYRANLAFRDAMDSSHEFLGHVADTMNHCDLVPQRPHAASQYVPPFWCLQHDGPRTNGRCSKRGKIIGERVSSPRTRCLLNG